MKCDLCQKDFTRINLRFVRSPYDFDDNVLVCHDCYIKIMRERNIQWVNKVFIYKIWGFRDWMINF